jgi:glycosyltransferase involved in cell wall biosynthesis
MTDLIHINCRFLSQPITGVQRYSHELLNQFDTLLEKSSTYKNIEIHCLVPPETDIKNQWKNMVTKTIGINRGNIWEQLDLPLYLNGKFLFSPTNTGPFLYRNQVLTIHDASVFAVPHAYSLPFKLKHKLIHTNLSRLAKTIITDSEFSRKELSCYLKQPIERFNVIHLAGNHINKIEPDLETLDKYGLRKKEYILIVASQSPHKNLKIAKEAVKLIKSQMKFVFVGGDYQKVFNKKSEQHTWKNAMILGYTNDCELKALYQNALGYLFPSYYEGFGLPILEAMNCGCPVICARAASLPEVAGEAALYFNPVNPAEIANAIDKIYFDTKLRDELIRRGYRRANEFNWQSTAEATLTTLLAAMKSKA